jgi:hypothetical protein
VLPGEQKVNFRFDDKQLADRLEAEVQELRSRLRFEEGRERRYTLDAIEERERVLRKMHC